LNPGSPRYKAKMPASAAVIGLIGFRQEDYMKRDVTKFVMKM
jgi:hypothetical protein